MLLRTGYILARRAAASRLACASAAGVTLSLVGLQEPPTNCASWFSSKEHYKLRYFNARGVAETARLVMVLGGANYEDERWDLDFTKPRDSMSPGMNLARSHGLLTANLERAPVLVVDGKHEIGQSKSIERYLAKKLGLLGRSDVEAAQIDAFTEHIRDLKDKYKSAKGATKDEALSTFFSSTMPAFLQKMEAVCSGSGRGPVIGKSLSLADVSLFILITDYFDSKARAKEALSGCPKLRASVEAVGADPRIAKYLAERPITAV